MLRINDRVNVLYAFFGPLVTTLDHKGFAGGLGLCLLGDLHTPITVGVLSAFLAYIARFYGAIESMIRMVAATQRAAASAQSLFEVLDREPSVPSPSSRSTGPAVGPDRPARCALQVRHARCCTVSTCPSQPGELIGLVGPSGAGKSTLVNLVCRFYDVAAGSILVDGIDSRLPGRRLSQAYRHCPSRAVSFYGRVAENIAYGRPDASRADIVAAARAARAHEFILRLPDGYDSLVGERGQSLSGGERQRISIARACLSTRAS